MRWLLAVSLCLFWALPRPAHAEGRFWDELRTPGLRTYRVALEDARRALAENAPERAALAAQRAIAARSDQAEAHRIYASALARQNELGAAAAAYRQAWELDRRCFDGENHAESAAIALMAGGNYVFAAELLERTIRALPDSRLRERLERRLSLTLLAAGPDQLDRALAVIRNAHRGANQSRQLSASLAVALYRRGELDPALSVAREVDGGHGSLTWLQEQALPPAELAWREAVFLEARGDRAGAATAFDRAHSFGGPWAARALARREALTSR